MGLFNRFTKGGPDMSDQPDDIARLRKAHFDLEDLPGEIARAGQDFMLPGDGLPITEATVDEIAFAILQAAKESARAYGRTAALERLYKFARQAGAVGTDLAVEAALKREAK